MKFPKQAWLAVANMSSDGSAVGLAEYRSNGGQVTQFTLAPYSQVNVSALAMATAQINDPYHVPAVVNANGYSPWNTEVSFSQAVMTLSQSAPGVAGWSGVYASATTHIEYDPVTGTTTRLVDTGSSTPTLLTLSYTNNSANEVQLYFTGTANVWGQSIAAVPEPETYALMLAGMGVVGAVARRRAQRPGTSVQGA